jgi:enamine deaminase RidA (YjgF/YER057c/UK114 family)
MKMALRREFLAKLGWLGGIAAWAASPALAQTGQAAPARRFIKNEAAQKNAYSQAVIVRGGETIYLAGQTSGLTDEAGRSLVGDFDGQVRTLFAAIGKTLQEAGGTLKDIVTMTVFIVEDRFDRRFLELRKEILGDNFPASAMINVHSLAVPGLLIEIQAIAVVA